MTGTAAQPPHRQRPDSAGGSSAATEESAPAPKRETSWIDLDARARRNGDAPAADQPPGDAPGPDGPAPDHEPDQAPPDLPAGRFLNRELSWLDFNARVLALAEDPRAPLLERAKFLAIFANNLDEFYMVRVAGLKRRLQTGLLVAGPDGISPREQLALIAERSADLVARHAACFADHVRPALAEHQVRIISWGDLNKAERERLSRYFSDQIFPVLTPLAVDPAHPFPYISGLSLNLAVVVRDPAGGPELFARVKVPNNVQRFMSVDAPGRPGPAASTPGDSGTRPVRFLPVEELIAAHLDQLFPGMRVEEHHVFRVTRNADLEVEDDRDEDLLQALERELARRRFGPPVRLEVAATISDHVLELLVRELSEAAEATGATLADHDVLRVPGLLDLSGLWQVHTEVDRPELKYRPFVPATHPQFAEAEVARSVFARLRDNDVLLHHPYHSFSTSVQRFVEQAAADPNVLAIKQTLYRTSGDSPVVDALIAAARAGKQVVVLVEVKARFDEQANIGWARMLERAGCHVVYGLVGLKTHCKTALVVRQESGQLRRYCHIGTGNYHPKTARSYEDFGLLTADPEVGADLTDLFNVLTGYSRQTGYRRLMVAPHGVRAGIIERIERQAARARAGGDALVQIKVNSIVDEEIIDALYRAGQAGVRVDLVVRGICTLRPGVAGLSENIRVRSILGRFLEHSRVFRFGAGDAAAPSNGSAGQESSNGSAGQELSNGSAGQEFWIGSADLMHRNLDRRVEALVRVSRRAEAELAYVFDTAMRDDVAAFDLAGDGVWHRRPGAQDLQELLLRRTLGRAPAVG